MSRKSSKEVFFSLDIEADGPIPVRNSMLSLGAVAFDETGAEVGYWEANLAPLPGAAQDERTMRDFWNKNPEAWAYCTSNVQDPAVALPAFVQWVNSVGADKQKVAVAFPSGFDFTWIYMYLMMFGGQSPFSFSCIDIKSYVSAMRRAPYRDCSKRTWPARWFEPKLKHTHKAVDDAREQGLSFMKMRAENLSPSTDGIVYEIGLVSNNFWDSQKP